MFEINLVPAIKEQAIKAIKLRNLIFFICIVVVAACAGILAVLGTIKGGQDIAMGKQDERLEKLSLTINGFDDLDELLTMQAQLNELDSLNSKKTMLSRIFNVLDTLMPTNGDEVTISELNVNLDESTISFDAQARAKTEPFINYNVLNAFKQSMGLMRYDFGRYVDENGAEIPTLCIKETKKDNGIVALWARGAAGCDPSDNDEGVAASYSEAQAIFSQAAAEGADEKTADVTITVEGDEGEEKEETKEKMLWTTIYRTPQFNDWYKEGKIALDGSISGIQHFESQCITYTGVEEDGKKVKWSSDNACELVPNGINITDSSDGRDGEGRLVLRFSAIIGLDPEVFAFRNKHMIAIAPTGKVDMTDSYIQVEGMFGERAEACYDAECKTSYEEDDNE